MITYILIARQDDVIKRLYIDGDFHTCVEGLITRLGTTTITPEVVDRLYDGFIHEQPIYIQPYGIENTPAIEISFYGLEKC